MAESAEVPEAKNPFERRVAVTVAVLVVFMAIFANRNDNAKTEAILATTQAADQWGYYQSKSVKEHAYEIQGRVLAAQAGDKPEVKALSDDFVHEAARYGKEKVAIRADAERLQHSVAHHMEINDRCDLGLLVLQIAAVLCSLAILVHWRAFWFIGIALGLIGIGIGASSYVIPAASSGSGGEPVSETASPHAPP